jgi:sugar phosphate permease
MSYPVLIQKERMENHKLPAYTWVILALITSTHAMNIFSARSIVPLAPFLQDAFNLSHFQIGLFTSMYFMGALVLSIPMGWMVDRIGIYYTMALGQLIVGSFIIALSCANSFVMLCVLLFLAGLGHAAINPATGKAVMHWFSVRGRATAMSFKQTGIPMGGALAAATLPSLALFMGWRKALIIAGSVSLFSVVLCLILYRESPALEQQNNGDRFHREDFIAILKNRNLMLLSGTMIIFLALQSSLETYLILFCKDWLCFPVVTAGFALSLTQVGAVGGRLLWGPVSDFIFKGRRKIVLAIIGSFSSVICLSFVFLSPPLPALLIGVMVFLFGACAIGWNGIYLTLVAELAGKGQEGIALGTSLTIIFVGQFLGPPIFGHIVDVTGTYRYAWLTFSLLMVGATILLGLVKEPRKYDR